MNKASSASILPGLDLFIHFPSSSVNALRCLFFCLFLLSNHHPQLSDSLPASGFSTGLWAAVMCPSTCSLVFGLVSHHFRERFLLVLFPLALIVPVMMPVSKARAATIWWKCRKWLVYNFLGQVGWCWTHCCRVCC